MFRLLEAIFSLWDLVILRRSQLHIQSLKLKPEDGF